MINTTEIVLFRPNGRKKEATIRSIVPALAVNALAERLGQDAADKADAAIKSMDKLDMDLIQIRHGDRRIRIKQTA